jgi:hypothetical protein
MDDLIETLAADLRPVRPRHVLLEAGALGLLLATELALWLLGGNIRPGLAEVAMTTPSFWWKIGSAAIVMILGAATVLAALGPDASPRRGLTALAAGAVAYLVLGAMLVAPMGLAEAAARLNPRGGLQCMSYVVMLSAPPLLALGLLMRRGAPTQPVKTALAGGLAAAGWGAFVFAFSCPHDDPLFIGVWYPASALVAAVAALVILPRISRW